MCSYKKNINVAFTGPCAEDFILHWVMESNASGAKVLYHLSYQQSQ